MLLLGAGIKNLFNDYSIEIISTLINSNFSVTLRVHPETLKRENKILSQIIKRFSDSPKFNLNVDLNDISSFENSEMLVTDNGGVGLEYGLIYETDTLYKLHRKNSQFKLQRFRYRAI